jgi:hypothetical protein
LDLPAGVVDAQHGHHSMTVIVMPNILYTGDGMRVIEVVPEHQRDDVSFFCV